jgi:hypothetical protein
VPVIINEFEQLPESPAAASAPGTTGPAAGASPRPAPPPAPRPAERSAAERTFRWIHARAVRVRAC